jgi:hypothetical protein
MPRVTTEQIFSQLFTVAKTVQGTDFAGNAIPLQFASRNWVKVAETADGVMPALYQLDPMPEFDTRTGLGRSRRKLHAQIDIRFQRQQPDQYPDVLNVANNAGPFSILVNNWIDNLYALFSPNDGGNAVLSTPTNPVGLVSDCYPISCKVDPGNDSSRVAVIYVIMELITGG